ncbi:MAG TPA: serine hydrolase [Gemmatimonadales bacterium]|nr:serine hydrolase [Gemmatimonadales bacterium]
MRSLRPFLAAALIAAAAPLSAQQLHPDHKLQRQLDQLVQGYQGSIGIYVQHIPSGRIAAIRADSVYPTASIVKLPILVGVFHAIAQGRLKYDQPLIYTDSLLYEGEDILGYFRDSTPIPLNQVTLLSITTSDNTASLWLQALAGGGAAINEWLATNGFDSTRVNSRTPGREGNRSVYGWGQTTPREIARLLLMIRQGKAVSQAASEEMYRHLTRIYWDGFALSQLPPWVQAASKQGFVNRSKSEVVLVNAPSGDYVFSVMTKENADSGYVGTNEGWEVARKLSALLWKYFEPKHPYTPPAGQFRKP